MYLWVPHAYYDSTVTHCAAVVQHLWEAAVVNGPSCTPHVLCFVKSGGYNHDLHSTWVYHVGGAIERARTHRLWCSLDIEDSMMQNTSIDLCMCTS